MNKLPKYGHSSVPAQKKAAPPSKAEQLSVDRPEEFDDIEEQRLPRFIPRLYDTERWERWFDNLIPATIAATIVTIISLMI